MYCRLLTHSNKTFVQRDDMFILRQTKRNQFIGGSCWFDGFIFKCRRALFPEFHGILIQTCEIVPRRILFFQSESERQFFSCSKKSLSRLLSFHMRPTPEAQPGVVCCYFFAQTPMVDYWFWWNPPTKMGFFKLRNNDSIRAIRGMIFL